jgi:ABC-type multidrug transport system ATPase subunit
MLNLVSHFDPVVLQFNPIPNGVFDMEKGLGKCVVCLCIDIFLYWCVLLYVEWRRTQKASHQYDADVEALRASAAADAAAGSGGGCCQKVVKKVVLDPEEERLRAEHRSRVKEDSDVIAERARVDGGGADGENIVIKHLRKVYPPRGGSNGKGGLPKEAVRDFCLGIKKGECFGLLGINGAGKSTTMNMLTGDFGPSSGTASLAGFDILSQLQEVQGQVGYCPQFDALHDKLTGRETLRLYAKLKGVPAAEMEAVVEGLVTRCDLSIHADNLIGGYSGGNKRKLSLAVALIGAPKLVFLDEPSTGMDPVARRAVWQVIQDAQADASIILTTVKTRAVDSRLALDPRLHRTPLTTHPSHLFRCTPVKHFMEEADALCGRIGIMVNGLLCCCNSPQALKAKYGNGYMVELQMDLSAAGGEIQSVEELRARSEASKEHLLGFLQQMSSQVKVLEYHSGHMRCQLPAHGLPLSTVFGQLESNKQRLGLVDYALSQTSLEQVFLDFAKLQEDEEGDK